MAEGRRLENLTWRLWTRETFYVDKSVSSGVEDVHTLSLDETGDACGRAPVTTATATTAPEIAPRNGNAQLKSFDADPSLQQPLSAGPQLSPSLASTTIASDGEQRSRDLSVSKRGKAHTKSNTAAKNSEIQTSNTNTQRNFFYTRENRRLTTPKSLEAMVSTIQEKRDLKPLFHPSGSLSNSAKTTTDMAVSNIALSKTDHHGVHPPSSQALPRATPALATPVLSTTPSRPSVTRAPQLPDRASFTLSKQDSRQCHAESQLSHAATAPVATKKPGTCAPSTQDMIRNFSPYDFSPSTVEGEACMRTKSQSQLHRMIVSAGVPSNRFASVDDLRSSSVFDNSNDKAVVRGFEPGRISSYRSCSRLVENKSQNGVSGHTTASGDECGGYPAWQSPNSPYAVKSATMMREMHEISQLHLPQNQTVSTSASTSSFSVGTSSADEEEHSATITRPSKDIGHDHPHIADYLPNKRKFTERSVPPAEGYEEKRIAEQSSFNSASTAGSSNLCDEDETNDSDWEKQAVSDADATRHLDNISSPVQRHEGEKLRLEQLQQISTTNPSPRVQSRSERPVQLTRQQSLLTMLINQPVTSNSPQTPSPPSKGHNSDIQMVPLHGPRTELFSDRPNLSPQTHAQFTSPVISQPNGNCASQAPESHELKRTADRQTAYHLGMQPETHDAPTSNTVSLQRWHPSSQMLAPSMEICQVPVAVADGLTSTSLTPDLARPLSPRTTRRNMLKTEMTQSLRDQILNERLHIFGTLTGQ